MFINIPLAFKNYVIPSAQVRRWVERIIKDPFWTSRNCRNKVKMGLKRLKQNGTTCRLTIIIYTKCMEHLVESYRFLLPNSIATAL